MTELSAYTEGDVRDIAICKRVADTLQRYYPGHQWLVGISDADMGMVVIDLPPQFKPPSLRLYAFLLHPKNYDDDEEVRDAGGEWLERIGLARAAALAWAEERAREHGLDLGNIVMKSRA